MWNTASEPDQVVAFSGLSQFGHQEPVSKVTWILNKDSRTGEYKVRHSNWFTLEKCLTTLTICMHCYAFLYYTVK